MNFHWIDIIGGYVYRKPPTIIFSTTNCCSTVENAIVWMEWDSKQLVFGLLFYLFLILSCFPMFSILLKPDEAIHTSIYGGRIYGLSHNIC